MHSPIRYSLLILIVIACTRSASATQSYFQRGDHVVTIGNTLADRMQHDGWLETYLHALLPNHQLTFRNLGFSGDEVNRRQRADNFGDADQWLTKCEADVVLCFFGYNEALAGKAGLERFSNELSRMIDQMRSQNYNGESAPRLIVFSPIAHEDLGSPHLPSGEENNEKLAMYTAAMQAVCKAKNVPFVDLFTMSKKLYAESEPPLTINGIHLLSRGNRLLAREILTSDDSPFASLGVDSLPSDSAMADLREAVLDKNYHWFSRYRVVDEYNVFGGRSKLAWFGQSNADVMMREMEIFDVKTENRDKRIWAVAQGTDQPVLDDNLPAELPVKPNRQGPLEGGAFPYMDAEEAISQMTVQEGLEVNLFASEKEFPRLINPVQMAVDTDSRLWVSVWPSYPHWNPTEPRRDAIVILPDEDNDGRADELIVFADELNSVTGFEFWGGGVLVAALPEIWFLKDTDGDDRADVKIRLLQGMSSADTHHSANAMLIGPDGWLYWSRGVFNVAAFETPTQTFRSGATGVYRFNPRTFEIEFHYPIGPNPHGDVFDRWGYQFANDGTSGTGGYVSIGKGQRPGKRQWFKKEWRPVAATGLLSSSHFPDTYQNNFLICNTIGFLGILQYEVKYNGAQITAERTDDLLRSNDPNFRPVDLEVGGDGALYVADWQNTLIGHMQHNMRDPNRDNQHGRIYRISAKGRAPLEPVKMTGKPIDVVLQNFISKENSVRYRTRIELSGRDTKQVLQSVESFTADLDPRSVSADRDEAQALLECLWVHEEHRVPNMTLIEKTFRADEPRVRAAAIRTLGHWANHKVYGQVVNGHLPGWENLLRTAAEDESALVRAEAVKAAVEFDRPESAEVVFSVAAMPTDPELDAGLGYARKQLDVDSVIAKAIEDQQPLSPAAKAYALANLPANLLRKMEDSASVYHAMLSRQGISKKYRRQAIEALATANNVTPVGQLVASIREAETQGHASLGDLTKLLPQYNMVPSDEGLLIRLADETSSNEVRRAAYATLWNASKVETVWQQASKSRSQMKAAISSMEAIEDSQKLEILYPLVRSLMIGLGPKFDDEVATQNTGDLEQQALKIIARWPGHTDEKIVDFAKLTSEERMATSALTALASLPTQTVAGQLTPSDASVILTKILSLAAEATPVERQESGYANWLDLGAALSGKRGVSVADADQQLAALRLSIPVQANPDVMKLGAEVYVRESHCATCHQPNGQGLPNLYPPLDDSLWVSGSEERLIRLVLDGLHGAIEIKGKRYSSPPLPPMTGFRQLLDDGEMAAVLTYVRNSWSNRAKPIDAEQVARMRAIERDQNASFWSVVDLLAEYPLEDGSLPPEQPASDGWVPRLVKEWKAEDFTASDLLAADRSLATGALAFRRIGCIQCHKIGSEGGSFGPSLADLDDKKRSPAYVLGSLLDPSKEIEDKYAMRTYLTDSGQVISGFVVKETETEIHVKSDPLSVDRPTIVVKDEIEDEKKNETSAMPSGLLNYFTKQEILDLIAYVLAAGDKAAP